MTAPIAQQQDAHRFAQRDRESAANLLINANCRTAIDVLRFAQRHGDPRGVEAAERILRRAAERAAKVLGGAR